MTACRASRGYVAPAHGHLRDCATTSVAQDFAARGARLALPFSDVAAVGLLVACTIHDQRLAACETSSTRETLIDQTKDVVRRWFDLELREAVREGSAGAYTIVLGAHISDRVLDATRLLSVDAGEWIMHELPNFSEFLHWMTNEEDDASASLVTTTERIAEHDAGPPGSPQPLTNGVVTRWAKRAR